MIDRNDVPDAPGLVEYLGLDAVTEACHSPSRFNITSGEYDTSPDRAEQYLAAGGNPQNVRFRRSIDCHAEDTFVLEQLHRVPDSMGDAAWLETFEQDIELGMDVLLASVKRLVAKGVLEYVGRERGKHATVRFVDPADVLPTVVEINDAFGKFFAVLNDKVQELSASVTPGDCSCVPSLPPTPALVIRARAPVLQGSRLAHANTRHVPGQPL